MGLGRRPLVVVPAGSFLMGSPSSSPKFDERPQRNVRLRAFHVGKYEVTVEEYNRFARATERSVVGTESDARTPATDVSWHDANAYALWLSEQTGERYRLPTEAEWEYAAAGGSQTTYWWGNESGANHANCFDCGSRWDRVQPAPVGSFEANGFGLHDTAGNVMEWVQDCYHVSYEGAPKDGAEWKGGDCTRRVVRGAAFDTVSDNGRTAKRGRYAPATRLNNIGFRLVRE